MNGTYYSGTAEAEDAMAVMARWISGNRKIQVQYHGGTAVDADVEGGVIRIPRMACASGVTQEALMMLRGRVYHEAGHVDESTAVAKKNYPQGALFSIWNALEDCRMEHAEASKHPGAAVVFNWSTDYYNREIGGKVTKGEVNAPLWEALCAMSFQVRGRQPLWVLKGKVKEYFNAAYSEFIKVYSCGDAADTLTLAKKIYEILKEKNKEINKEKTPQDSSENGKGKPEKKEKKEEGGKGKNEEPQSGAAGDMDDDEEGKEGSGSGEGKKEEDKHEGEGEGEGDWKDGEGDDSENGLEGEGEGEGKGDEAGEGEGKGKGKGSGEGEKEGEAGEGESRGPGGGKYEINEDEEAKGGIGDGRDLEEEINGISQEEVINAKLSEIFKEMSPADLEYTSRRDLDEHSYPEVDDQNKVQFKQERNEISVMVASMTQALEQALRSLTRCRRKPYLRQGKIDHKRLVTIAKGLSKEVFFRKQDGIDLNVAVAITIDESGSMRNYREVRKMAVAIGEALQAIGVPFSIIGSTTRYACGNSRMPPLDGFSRTNPIIYKHYKDFNESWMVVRHRMTTTGHHEHNVDGEVVEYAAFELAKRKETRKIVFVLSDGAPEAGHWNNPLMIKNIKRVCNRVRKAGIEVKAFGLSTRDPSGLYGESNFVYLDGTDKMGPEFVKKFANVVTGGLVKV